jgi:hypothetical protein
MTDSSGRFVFQRLAAGSYGVRVVASGYLSGGYGRVPGFGAVGQIALQDQQWFREANAVLWKPASISGTVRDERGDPMVDVSVRILMAFKFAGGDGWAAGTVTQTDDRGAYRFAGLLPGRYIVQVPSVQVTLPSGAVWLPQKLTKTVPLPAIPNQDGSGTVVGTFPVPPEGHGEVYASTFAPSSRSLPMANVIAVDFGSDVRAVDVSLPLVPSVGVSGVVIGPTTAIAGLPVRLLASGNESMGFGGETALTITDASGHFKLSHVPSGNYTVIVGRALKEFAVDQPDGPSRLAFGVGRMFLDNISGASVGGEPRVYVSAIGMAGEEVTGRVTLAVGTEAIEGLVVQAAAGVTVSGRAFYDGADAPANGRTAGPFGPRVRLDPADADVTRSMPYSALVHENPAPATFSISNVTPGRYRLVDQGNRDYRLVGATWNGQDIFATPLEVTGTGPISGVVVQLSSKQNSVSGRIRTADGQKPSAGVVLIFPSEPSRWREPGVGAPLFRWVDVSSDGQFSTTNLIPGDYLIAALPVEERRRGFDTQFFQGLVTQATSVTMTESATLTFDLRIIGKPR